MRRRLIQQSDFDKILNESVATAKKELVEAESILGHALGKEFLTLKSFTESTVIYEAKDGTYVQAGYQIRNGKVTFSNVEEVVIDEASQKEKRRNILSDMLEAIVTDNEEKANEMYQKYLGMVRWNEAKKEDCDKEHDKKSKGKEKKEFFFGKAKKAGKEIAEAYQTSQNVLDYVNFMKVGPALAEAVTKTDDKGNIVDIQIPTIQARNESKLLRFNWKTLNAKAADCRKKIPYFAENKNFCDAVANIKKQNAMINNEALEEAINNVITSWPEVLYATHSELSSIIGEALRNANVASFDDKTCDFMAEGILRTAHAAYGDRVKQILHLASATKIEEGVDAYEHFQTTVENFYPSLDEKFGLERKVFVDLYDSLADVYKKADRQGNKTVKNESASYLNELSDILNDKVKPQIEFAEEAANYLAQVIETNLESGTWVVSNSPHITVNGDHPDMAKKASHGYTPSKDSSGNWGDEAPAIGQEDHNYKSGKHAKTMRHNSWGQEGGSDVFPSLNNPYIPKTFGDFTMKHEKGVDKDNKDWSLHQGKDTWPNLKNPITPKEDGGVGGKGYKMKNGSDTDLVVNR